MNTQQAYVLVLVCGALVACRENQVVDPNLPPTAEAMLVDPDGGELVDTLELEYDGSAVTIELDGSGSSDEDGEIVEYRWLSSNTDGDGMGRGGPEPKDSDKQNTEVTLEDEGQYYFSLWVKDDDDSFSDASTVSITFGTPPPPGDAADGGADGGGGGSGECTPFDGLSDACKDCTCAECPVETSDCDETCWGLISCVASECAGDGMDTACIVAACGPFLGAAATATAAGPCATTCTDECSM